MSHSCLWGHKLKTDWRENIPSSTEVTFVRQKQGVRNCILKQNETMCQKRLTLALKCDKTDTFKSRYWCFTLASDGREGESCGVVVCQGAAFLWAGATTNSFQGHSQCRWQMSHTAAKMPHIDSFCGKGSARCTNHGRVRSLDSTALTVTCCHLLCLDFESFLILCLVDEWLFLFFLAALALA